MEITEDLFERLIKISSSIAIEIVEKIGEVLIDGDIALIQTHALTCCSFISASILFSFMQRNNISKDEAINSFIYTVNTALSDFVFKNKH